MNVFETGFYVAVFPFLSSPIFFFLGKERDWLRRTFSSLHGWAALGIFPVAALIAKQLPDLKVALGVPVILLLGGVSAVSVFYAIATVKGRWAYQLLHVPTVFTIYLSLVLSLFVLGNHH